MKTQIYNKKKQKRKRITIKFKIIQSRAHKKEHKKEIQQIRKMPKKICLKEAKISHICLINTRKDYSKER